ncbi:hypothetical protein COOONC_15161, partial [Cooperia oncophora]
LQHQGYNCPLLFFQDALRIQSIFDCCPLLRTLGYDVLRMKGLLSADKLRHAEEDEIIIPRSDRKVLIFFSGTITVENEKTTTYRLEANRADFRPYISGRSLVKRIFKDLATMTIDHRSTVQQFMSKIDDSRKQMRFVLASQRGEALMQEMMKGDQHLCAVMKFSYGRYRVVGLITLEDVIEEVFGDIEDDSDKMWNNRRAGVHKDQQTLDWFRTSEAEQFAGLGVNATLRLIQ